MGQAFDRDGNVLGEAEGDTKREVFEKLNLAHKDAAEIRIRKREAGKVQTELPRYKCHKEVWALKIERIEYDNTKAQAEQRQTDGSALLVFADSDGIAPIRVNANYLKRHDPHFGGYYVVYKDGYQSFSPAQAFEEGYTRQ